MSGGERAGTGGARDERPMPALGREDLGGRVGEGLDGDFKLRRMEEWEGSGAWESIGMGWQGCVWVGTNRWGWGLAWWGARGFTTMDHELIKGGRVANSL
jgi:hypothetical protein